MFAENEFRDLIARVRAQDGDACSELLRRFAPTLLRIARVRIQYYGLQREVGASDILQSVMAHFLLGAAEGKYELDKSADFQNLMGAMIGGKVNDHGKKQHAAKRGGGRRVATLDGDIRDPKPTAVELVAAKDLREKILNELSLRDQRLVQFVLDGFSWQEIGDHCGISQEAARKRFDRICAGARRRWRKEADHE